jgi:hypothetical protein
MMLTVLPKNNLIDDLPLQKYHAIQTMERAIDFICKKNEQKITRTASNQTLKNGQETLIELFSQMLSVLKLNSSEDGIKKIVGFLSSNNNENKETQDIFEKTAAIRKNSKEKRDEIKIVSKSQKDSHYQIDVSKDLISKDNKKMFMISCYARDAYLGRYLIKRNFFYTAERETSADDAYGEIILKMAALKDRYYNEIVDVSAIFAQMKKILDGVVSEIHMEEDSLPTNVKR